MTQPLHDEGDPEAYAGDAVPDPWPLPEETTAVDGPTVLPGEPIEEVSDGQLDSGAVPADPAG